MLMVGRKLRPMWWGRRTSLHKLPGRTVREMGVLEVLGKLMILRSQSVLKILGMTWILRILRMLRFLRIHRLVGNDGRESSRAHDHLAIVRC